MYFYIALISIQKMLTAQGVWYASKCIEAVPAEDSNPGNISLQRMLMALEISTCTFI
jgi:hypothetical protein